jgi:hypothetical protein
VLWFEVNMILIASIGFSYFLGLLGIIVNRGKA